jgi:hypothetical protein
VSRNFAGAFLAAVTLALTACGGGEPGSQPRADAPSSYTLRPDLCEVLDYQSFSRWFGTMQPWSGDSVGTAKVVCTGRGIGFTGNSVTTRVEAFKYESAQEARKIFDRFAKPESNMDGKLKAEVQDVRYYDDYAVLVLDGDLYLKVTATVEALNDSSFKSDMPGLIVGLTDQVVERLREKS